MPRSTSNPDTVPRKVRLTDTVIRNAKPKHNKQYKMFDERGLFLLVTATGSKGWRFRYRFAGREKLISLGVYPDVSLKMAREKRDAARRLLAEDPPVDPSARRQAAKRAHADTFEAVAREWMEKAEQSISKDTVELLRRRLELYVFPAIGRRQIASITAPELLAPLRRIENRKRFETARRTRSACGRIFRYAIATGRAERDVAADLKGALVTVRPKHFAAITEPKRIGELLRAIESYQGQPTVLYALRLAPLVFVRPGELRAAEWDEFDLDAAEWRIRAERTKMKTAHLVPLAQQAITLLDDLYELTGTGRFLFPSLRSRNRCMSDNTMNAALRRLGFGKDEMTSHGFRSMASTRLNEMGFPPDVIELQLAHAERNKVRAAYNRAERLSERRKMMQVWASYLDALRAGETNITALRQRRRHERRA